jgi:transaldolase
MKENRLRKLQSLGQSIWLDYTRRDLIATGELRQLIEEDGLSGMTSNPSIFEKAIARGEYYDGDIREMAFHGRSPIAIYEALTQSDIQSAADVFRPVYDRTNGEDGYVSLEVNPHLAHDTRGTIIEARRLWRALNRPNALVKVPATAEGIPAIQQLISEGISVNVTLLFGLPRYRQVVEAYLAGLEARTNQGQSLKWVVSVASFFLSRIDAAIDPLLENIIGDSGQQAELARKLHGQVAIASAVRAYQIYGEIFGGERFKALEQNGAGVQRLLWASTSTKNPTYSELKYVEALIGPNTINTVPIDTLKAYRAHGEPQSRLQENVQLATWVLRSLPDTGINLDHLTQELEDEGVAKFNEAFDMLIETLTKKARDLRDAHTINEKGTTYVA